jgi:hypothetical protein
MVITVLEYQCSWAGTKTPGCVLCTAAKMLKMADKDGKLLNETEARCPSKYRKLATQINQWMMSTGHCRYSRAYLSNVISCSTITTIGSADRSPVICSWCSAADV